MSQTQLSALFVSGHIVNFTLALMAVAAAVLLGHFRKLAAANQREAAKSSG